MNIIYDYNDVKGAIKFADSPMGGQQLTVYKQLSHIIDKLTMIDCNHPEFLNAVQNFISFYKGTVKFLLSGNNDHPFDRVVNGLMFSSGFMEQLSDKISNMSSIYTNIYPKKEWYSEFNEKTLENMIQNSIFPMLVNIPKNLIEIGMECLFQEILVRDILPFKSDGKYMVAKGLHTALADWFLHM